MNAGLLLGPAAIGAGACASVTVPISRSGSLMAADRPQSLGTAGQTGHPMRGWGAELPSISVCWR